MIVRVATIADVARAAGVSIATVSRVLSPSGAASADANVGVATGIKLGTAAIEIAGRASAGETVERRVLAPRLIERESTLGPGGRFTR
jgi:DNA-binding LacI/PurR family transcriptional regulator